MLLELKRPFDVIDPSARFADYGLLILPDSIPVYGDLEPRLAEYIRGGGRIIFSGTSAIDADRSVRLPAGIECVGPPTACYPTYLRAVRGLDAGMPETPFVMYGVAQTVAARDAEVLAEVAAPYFNRTYAHFSSHQHAPDNPDAPAIGAGVTRHGNVAYVAYPIFEMYQAIGQPLEKWIGNQLSADQLPVFVGVEGVLILIAGGGVGPQEIIDHVLIEKSHVGRIAVRSEGSPVGVDHLDAATLRPRRVNLNSSAELILAPFRT
jgi:hypothetical protein